MKYLSESEFKSRFTMEDYLAACRQAFVLYGSGEIVNPGRREEVGEGYFRLEMRAEWKDRYRVCKTIEEGSEVGSGRLGERRAVIELENVASGDVVTMDADHITDMRTGAAGALAVEYLAREPVRRVGILGTGRVGQMLALAVDGLFELDSIKATSRSRENRDAFAQRLDARLDASLTMVDSLAECIGNVDAVLTAVPTPEPILTEEKVSDIPVLAVMGGDSRTRQLAPEVLEKYAVVVDHVEQAGESGEYRYAREAEIYDRIRFARTGQGRILTLGDAACGVVAAAEPARVAYLTGLAAQDLCAGVMVSRGESGSE